MLSPLMSLSLGSINFMTISYNGYLLYEQIFAHTIFVFKRQLLFKISRRCLNISNKELQINDEIRDAEIRLVGADGSQIGLVSNSKAKSMAEQAGLDLVKIAAKAVPPVCKIMDYGKYKFEVSKREKESRKNQRTFDVKEVRLSLNIDKHDFETKVGHVERFAKSGDKIKVSIRFRGREAGHPEIGYDIMSKFAEACSEFASVERPAKLDGRSMLMFLAPKVTKNKPEKS